MSEFEYEDEFEFNGGEQYRHPYNPDKINEWAINQEIHGRKYKPMTDGQFYRREEIYDNFLKVTKKSKKVKNTK